MANISWTKPVCVMAAWRDARIKALRSAGSSNTARSIALPATDPRSSFSICCELARRPSNFATLSTTKALSNNSARPWPIMPRRRPSKRAGESGASKTPPAIREGMAAAVAITA